MNIRLNERTHIERLFQIRGGYIFANFEGHNKNRTQQLILESCNIDIYNDPEYNGKSQQRCIEYIFEKCRPQVIAKLLEHMLKYYLSLNGARNLDGDDEVDIRMIQNTIERLRSIPDTNLTFIPSDLQSMKEDIEDKINNNTPELALSTLHTCAMHFLKKACENHNISIEDEPALHSLVGKLVKWYHDNNVFQSEFPYIAIKYSISIFEKFNAVRNNSSSAHDNELLNKEEAFYVINIVTETLSYIDKLEKHLKEKELMNIISPPF